jgi:hypothetical protein|tara:strand:+ start:696 stop:935 length:240 start_codon:yes stop_codon:yes gene_type:complete
MINNNIKFIIKKYLTYSDSELEKYKSEWKVKIKKVNKLFSVSNFDYQQLCYFCNDNHHLNFECPIFYWHVDYINSRVLR